jgi:hypothetical protein
MADGARIRFPDGHTEIALVTRAPVMGEELWGPTIKPGWIVTEVHVLEGEENGTSFVWTVSVERRTTDDV